VTPAARLSAAIAVLDRALTGVPVEQALTNWGRANRYAGSGDRNAVRDLVYDAVRCRRSFAALGGALTGRGLILGLVRAAGQGDEVLFTGEGHAPAVISAAEMAIEPAMTANVALDCPDWLAPELQASLGADFAAVMQALQTRAPLFLRVNLAKSTRENAIARLSSEGITAVPVALASTALEVTANPRKVAQSRAYSEGLVELQDAASQAVVLGLPVTKAMRILDYCAGGGGKSLALAARLPLDLTAHDVNPARMADLPARAARAGARIRVSAEKDLEGAAPFDMVLVDAPCSGSGAWRRSPEGKWTLSPDRLADLVATQASILDRTKAFVAQNGAIAYVTCSLLNCENGDQVANFRAQNQQFALESQRRFTPLDGGDGFYCAILRRVD
jgi:16S rRNA (cytosine967-C5)-methyltransferase